MTNEPERMKAALKAFMNGDGSALDLAKKYKIPYRGFLVMITAESIRSVTSEQEDIVYELKMKNALRSKEYTRKLSEFVDHIQVHRVSKYNTICIAADTWWHFRGQVSAHIIAMDFSCNLRELTNKIRNDMAERYFIDIPDQTPDVIVHNTKEGIDLKYPKCVTRNMTMSLDLFYQIAKQNEEKQNRAAY